MSGFKLEYQQRIGSAIKVSQVLRFNLIYFLWVGEDEEENEE